MRTCALCTGSRISCRARTSKSLIASKVRAAGQHSRPSPAHTINVLLIGAGVTYERVKARFVPYEDAAGAPDCVFVYVSLPSSLVDDGPCSRRYRDLLVSGARAAALHPGYVDQLERLPVSTWKVMEVDASSRALRSLSMASRCEALGVSLPPCSGTTEVSAELWEASCSEAAVTDDLAAALADKVHASPDATNLDGRQRAASAPVATTVQRVLTCFSGVLFDITAFVTPHFTPIRTADRPPHPRAPNSRPRTRKVSPAPLSRRTRGETQRTVRLPCGVRPTRRQPGANGRRRIMQRKSICANGCDSTSIPSQSWLRCEKAGGSPEPRSPSDLPVS